uniref:Uncharacterized protein n=1 Tax=Zea mays TaxID=4577 RepID=C4IZR9_MAIZE|nr:unknown [Zea mays]
MLRRQNSCRISESVHRDQSCHLRSMTTHLMAMYTLALCSLRDLPNPPAPAAARLPAALVFILRLPY